MVFVPGLTVIEFPAFANTRLLATIGLARGQRHVSGHLFS